MAVVLQLPTSEYIPLPWKLQRKEKYIYSGIHLLGSLRALASVEPQNVMSARGCCVSRHVRPSSAGPEKDSGLVLEPS